MELRELRRSDLDEARRVLDSACQFDRAADVAGEKLFGPAPGAKVAAWAACADERIVGVAAASKRWVRLVAVEPEARGNGAGSALLARAEDWIAAAGFDTARALDQPGNYLSPGIDARNSDAIEWMTRRGWIGGDENVNLLVDVTNNPRVTGERLADAEQRARAAGYELSRAGAGDKAAHRDAIAAAFTETWAFEVDRADAHFATRDGQLAAFAAHDGNNRGLGWFGPAGTFEAHRKRGLGQVLLLRCLLDVAGAGHDHCAIAWIGPRSFYERAASIAGERRYLSMTKPL